ncbi:MAG: FAD-dependent oxidoreductase [Ruminococcaceae bacterium]|nr:FAD-dependent oxidoreductase [Oscillospiraceae bacterium]
MMSVWKENSVIPKFEKLQGDIKTDVLVIGGGITGILTAYFLRKSGVKYALVEKGRLCECTTKNTTAKITFQHGLIYDKLLENHGVLGAQMYLYANEQAFKKYAELCKDIDCDYEVKDNYIYSCSNRAKLENEVSALEKIGFSAQLCENLTLPFKTKGAVCFKNQAQFNPLKFLSVIANGLNIYENTFVRELIGTTAITDNGKIYAKKVIVTTHFPFINKHGSYFLKLFQHRSYVLALKKAPNLNGMYADENLKGLSFRNYSDMLLLSGGAHRTGKTGGNWKELRQFAAENFPDSQEKYFWATQDCMSLDGIPYIGNYSKNTPNLYVASGFNKWGMTSAMVAACILTDAVLGVKNDYSEIFSPSRNIIKPQLFINGLESAAGLISFSKKRCPHLGCALKWNSAEHTWDCPCHGSRFEKDGRVIDNPANGNLKI